MLSYANLLCLSNSRLDHVAMLFSLNDIAYHDNIRYEKHELDYIGVTC